MDRLWTLTLRHIKSLNLSTGITKGRLNIKAEKRRGYKASGKKYWCRVMIIGHLPTTRCGGT